MLMKLTAGRQDEHRIRQGGHPFANHLLVSKKAKPFYNKKHYFARIKWSSFLVHSKHCVGVIDF